jgi:hypothetical protein
MIDSTAWFAFLSEKVLTTQNNKEIHNHCLASGNEAPDNIL